jgi:hypothetical protein
MNAQQIKDFKTAINIVKTFKQPDNETATEEDWEMYHFIYNNAEDIIWTHAEAVMKNESVSLKNLMIGHAADCDKEWNGTEFVDC